MSSKLAEELLGGVQDSLGFYAGNAALPSLDDSLDEVRTVLDSFRVRVTTCWCFDPENHTPRCKAANELFEKLRKE